MASLDARHLAPKIVTFPQLYAVLIPYCAGYAWAEDAIRDLWLLGAPVPRSNPSAPEARILLPSKFAAWWADVQQRMGFPDALGAGVHKSIRSIS